MKTDNQGFTLIELVMVIVILGILAAAAIPKFINLEQDARISTVNAMRGAVSTGAMLARSKAIIDGVDVSAGSSSANLDGAGANEVLAYGYPDSADSHTMNWIIEDMGDFTYVAGSPGRYELTTNCYVQYSNATGPSVSPSITMVTTGC